MYISSNKSESYSYILPLLAIWSPTETGSCSPRMR